MTSAGAAIAKWLAESVIAEMQRDGVALRVHWLVYPTNLASIVVSRTVFPEVDETYPSEDKPCASFMRALSLSLSLIGVVAIRVSCPRPVKE